MFPMVLISCRFAVGSTMTAVAATVAFCIVFRRRRRSAALLKGFVYTFQAKMYQLLHPFGRPVPASDAWVFAAGSQTHKTIGKPTGVAVNGKLCIPTTKDDSTSINETKQELDRQSVAHTQSNASKRKVFGNYDGKRFGFRRTVRKQLRIPRRDHHHKTCSLAVWSS